MKKIFLVLLNLISASFIFAQTNINYYEYWFDNDYAGKVNTSVSPVSSFTLAGNIPTNSLPTGLHSFHIRFRDSNSEYSSVISQFFVKPPVPVTPNNIVAYEYWFDSDYAGKVNTPVSPASSFTLAGNISANSLAIGLHSFHIRFRDTNSRFSSVISQFFVKQSGGVYPTNLITKYRYWFNMADSAMITVNIPTPINQYQLVQNICTGNLPVGNHSIHFQFKDSSQLWSSVTIDSFFKSTPTPIITASGTTTFCQGNSVTLTANSGSSYLWSNGATTQNTTVTSSGNYSVTIDNVNGCSSVAVTVNPLPLTPTISPNGITLISSSSTGNQWYLNGNLISGATSQNYSVTQNGNYTVAITDINGCSATSIPYNYSTVGIQDLILNNSVVIFPNPNKGVFRIETNNINISKLKIYNTLGETIYESTNQNSEIDLTAKPKGIYFIEIKSNENAVSKKLIIE